MRRRSVVSLLATCVLLTASPVLATQALVPGPRPASLTPDRGVAGLLDIGVVTAPTGVARIRAAHGLGPDGAMTSDDPARRAAVAILDTGIAGIPELNVVGGYDCSGVGSFSDSNGHGTHVAGIVAARRAAGRVTGVIGVSPGTPLYAVRVFDSSGSGPLEHVICGLNWVAEHAAAYNIKVVNMSLGDPGSDDGRCGRTEDPFHVAV